MLSYGSVCFKDRNTPIFRRHMTHGSSFSKLTYLQLTKSNIEEYLAGGYNPKMDYGDYNCDLHTDIEQIPFDEGSLDAILCIKVPEHVANPFKAQDEMYIVLKSGGKVFITTPFMVGYHGKTKNQNIIHDNDEYPDYFRYTHQVLSLLFKQFTSVKIELLSGPVKMLLTNARLFKYLKNPVIRKLVDIINFPKVSKQTTRHLVYAIK